MSMKEEGGLSKVLTKELLVAFESSGKARSTFVLRDLCDEEKLIWGVKGSDTRRLVQQRWDKLKHKPIQAYIKYLKAFKGVIIGQTTLDELAAFYSEFEEEEEEENEENEESEESEANKESEEYEESNLSSPGQEKDPFPPRQNPFPPRQPEKPRPETIMESSNFEDDDVGSRQSRNSRHHQQRHQSPPPGAFTKEQKMPSTPSTPLSSSHGDTGSFQGTPSMPSFVHHETGTPRTPPPYPSSHQQHRRHPSSNQNQQHVFGETSALVQPAPHLSWLSHQDGSKRSPWIIMVNDEFPERNREFDIQWVQKMKRDGWDRWGFNIRKAVCILDYQKWTARIPKFGGVSTDQYPVYPLSYLNRLIVVNGPSQDSWVKNVNRFHQGTGKFTCSATKDAHTATQTAIKNNPERQESFWLLVFPQGIQLNNQILSTGHEHLLPKTVNSVTSKKEHEDHIFNKEVKGMTLSWEIAVTGGEEVSTQDNDPNPDELV
jgi:hypothetical protein